MCVVWFEHWKLIEFHLTQPPPPDTHIHWGKGSATVQPPCSGLRAKCLAQGHNGSQWRRGQQPYGCQFSSHFIAWLRAWTKNLPATVLPLKLWLYTSCKRSRTSQTQTHLEWRLFEILKWLKLWNIFLKKNKKNTIFFCCCWFCIFWGCTVCGRHENRHHRRLSHGVAHTTTHMRLSWLFCVWNVYCFFSLFNKISNSANIQEDITV